MGTNDPQHTLVQCSMGPYQLTKRNREHSYTLHFGPNDDDREVHVDQLKPCWAHPTTETFYPMVYRQRNHLSSTVESQVRRVLEAKTTPEGLQFLVQWSEEAGGAQAGYPRERSAQSGFRHSKRCKPQADKRKKTTTTTATKKQTNKQKNPERKNRLVQHTKLPDQV